MYTFKYTVKAFIIALDAHKELHFNNLKIHLMEERGLLENQYSHFTIKIFLFLIIYLNKIFEGVV